MDQLRIAVLGAGPIGLEAALQGRSLGHDVVIFEQGEVGESVSAWRHVRMFSPWSMNRSALSARRLFEAGYAAPDEAACPTGAELVEQYLLPLSRDPLFSGRLRLHSRVVAIGRDGLLKGDLIGRPGRTRHRFRMLIEDHGGEHIEHADVILDCSGTYGCPNALGDGGIPAPGERWLGDRLARHIPDVLGRDRERFARRRVLLVGGGLSAATAASQLGQLIEEAPGTELLWVVRREGLAPYTLIDGDALPGRDHLMRTANSLAQRGERGQGPLLFRHGAYVEEMAAVGSRLRVTLRSGADHWQEELCDEVIALVGYGPDNGLYRELQVHECYASRGPMKLAALLLSADAGGDCLAQPAPGKEALRSPEPRFFLLGAKSYGKNSTFLLRAGHGQIAQVFALLHQGQQI